MIGQTADEFMEKEMVPRLPEILKLNYEAHPRAPAQGRRAGPARASRSPRSTAAWASTRSRAAWSPRRSARDGSFAVTFMGHTGIGTLPIVYFGTEAQKKKYLPKLASGEWISSYSLSEASLGQRRHERQGPGRALARTASTGS